MTMIPVNSSAIRAVGYDGYTLTVEFHDSGIYDHPGVLYSVCEGLMRALSKGISTITGTSAGIIGDPMSVTRNGKIARLPSDVRDRLNCRLHDGEEGKKLVAWLNALPEVQAIVAAEFDGKPIRQQNLSEWKQGGYREWLAQQEAFVVAERLAGDSLGWNAEGNPPLTDMLARWLAARYAMATRRIAKTEGPKGWRLLREICSDIAELRRGDHSAQRLELERERVAVEARNADRKWKRKIIVGLETLTKYADKHPKAKAAMEELARQVCHPFDPTESD